MHFIPMKDGFGAIVDGFREDSSVDADSCNRLREALGQFRLLVLRGMALSPEKQVRFGRIFGDLEVHVLNAYHKPQHPEIFELSNIGPDGFPNAVHPDKGTLLWHTDASWQGVPVLATMLFAVKVPVNGGHTLFADMIRAYEGFSPTDQGQFLQLDVIHDLHVSLQKSGGPGMTEEKQKERPPVIQPLVRWHEPTGRNAIYLGSHARNVVGLADIAGRGLIERIMNHCIEPRFVYEHIWRTGDMVIWDNRATMHRATEYDTAIEPRVLRRTVVKGSPVIRGRTTPAQDRDVALRHSAPS
ncbi:MAG: TauD/TfdA family dioxygenase [Planctomycetes bacterium]|nr:TauD/TfdA family dioxygenase [Planctomycetota bacterium]